MNQSAEAVTLHVGEATVSIPAKSLVLAWLEKETRGTAAPLHTCISSAEFFHSPSFRQCSVSTPCPLLTLRIAAVDIFVSPTASACVFPSA